MFPAAGTGGKCSGRRGGEAQTFDLRLPGAESHGISAVEDVAATGRLHRRDRNGRQVADWRSAIGSQVVTTPRSTGHRGAGAAAAVQLADDLLVRGQAGVG